MAALDLGTLSTLQQGEDGIWRGEPAGALSYPEHGNEDCLGLEERSFWFAHRNQVLLDLLRRFPPAGAVFDVGAGNGFVSLALQGAGFEVVAIEPGAVGAANAKARGVDTVVCATLAGAGFAAGSLPAVGLFDVLEHLPDPVDFLRLAGTLLRPGGRLYLTVPAHRWLWSADDRWAGHYRRYDRRSLRDVLTAAGFEPEWTSHFFTWLALPILLLRALPGRLGSDGGANVEAASQRHRPREGFVGRFLAGRLRVEAARLARGRTRRLGASLVAVARRPTAPSDVSRR